MRGCYKEDTRRETISKVAEFRKICLQITLNSKIIILVENHMSMIIPQDRK